MIKMNSRLFEEVKGGDTTSSGGGGDSASLLTGAAATTTAASTQAAASTTQAATTTGTTPAWFGELFTSDGKVNKAAYDKAPESVKKFRSSLEQYETPEALFHALGHTKSLVGAKGLSRLDPSAPQEAKDAQAKVLREVLGIPEKPEGYGLAKPEKLPEGVTWDDKTVGEFATLAHQHNVPPEFVKKAVEWHMGKMGEGAMASVAEIAKTREAELGKLTAELPAGTTIGDYLGKAEKGMAVASKITGIPVDALKGMATNAAMVKLLHGFAQVTAEDKLIDAGTDVATKGYDDQIKALMNSPAYTSSEESVRKPVLAEISRLTALQYKVTK